MLPTGKVLYISQPKYPVETEYDGGNATVWDPATDTFTAVPPPVVDYPEGPDRPANLWCSGHVQLADGRVWWWAATSSTPPPRASAPATGTRARSGS